MANKHIPGSAFRRVVAVLTAFTIAVLPLAVMPTPASAHEFYRADNCPSIRSLLLLPIDNTSGSQADSLPSMIDDAVSLRLSTINRFNVVTFSRMLPAVQQALVDKTITDSDVDTPFGDNGSDQTRALTMARLVGADAFFVANLEVGSVDEADKTVSLQLGGDVYSAKDGSLIKHVSAAVISKALTDTDQIDEVVQSAVDATASQISRCIYAIPGVEIQNERRRAEQAGVIAGVFILLTAGLVFYEANRSFQNGFHAASPPPGFPMLRF